MEAVHPSHETLMLGANVFEFLGESYLTKLEPQGYPSLKIT